MLLHYHSTKYGRTHTHAAARSDDALVQRRAHGAAHTRSSVHCSTGTGSGAGTGTDTGSGSSAGSGTGTERHCAAPHVGTLAHTRARSDVSKHART